MLSVYVIEKKRFFVTLNFPLEEMCLPLVVVVVEGDMDTLEHTSELIEKGIPLIVIKGTGKAADFIANCMEEYVHNFAMQYIK